MMKMKQPDKTYDEMPVSRLHIVLLYNATGDKKNKVSFSSMTQLDHLCFTN